MSDALVTIASYENALEAEIVKGRLESEGIQAFLSNSHTVGMDWTLSQAVGGVVLSVLRDDAERAAHILGITK